MSVEKAKERLNFLMRDAWLVFGEPPKRAHLADLVEELVRAIVDERLNGNMETKALCRHRRDFNACVDCAVERERGTMTVGVKL